MMSDVFKGLGVLLISTCFFVPSARAQVDEIFFDSTITATPSQFGNAGTLVHLKAVSNIPVSGPTSNPVNGAIFRPNNQAGIVPCNGTATGKLECECVYKVQPSDVAAGQLILSTSSVFEDTWDSDPITGLPLNGEVYYGSGEQITLTHNAAVTSYSSSAGIPNCAPIKVDAGPDFFAVPGSVINLAATVNQTEIAPLPSTTTYRWKASSSGLGWGVMASAFGGTFTQQNPTFTLPLTAVNNTQVSVNLSDGYQSVFGALNIVSTVNNGCAPQSSALMPSTQSPGNFTFTIPVNQVCPNLFWIDPPIATGYDYTVTGAQFKTIQMPSTSTVPDQDGYELILSGGTSVFLSPDQIYNFSSPVSSFNLRGIDTGLALDPEDAFAFALGVDLTTPVPGVSHVEINQAVFTENVITPVEDVTPVDVFTPITPIKRRAIDIDDIGIAVPPPATITNPNVIVARPVTIANPRLAPPVAIPVQKKVPTFEPVKKPLPVQKISPAKR